MFMMFVFRSPSPFLPASMHKSFRLMLDGNSVPGDNALSTVSSSSTVSVHIRYADLLVPVTNSVLCFVWEEVVFGVSVDSASSSADIF